MTDSRGFVRADKNDPKNVRVGPKELPKNGLAS